MLGGCNAAVDVRFLLCTGIARKANKQKDYARADCYGKVALYTNAMALSLGIVGYLAISIKYGML